MDVRGPTSSSIRASGAIHSLPGPGQGRWQPRWPDATRAISWLGLLVAALAGAAIVVFPMAVVIALPLAAFVGLVSFGKRVIPVFQGSLLFILIGYAFLGRGLAYLGFAPVYIGEVVLGLAIVAILVSIPGARWHPVHLVLGAFMIWGAARTIPYLGRYEIDALRDGVIYIWGFFAIAVSLTVGRRQVADLIEVYGRCIPWFVFVIPPAVIITSTVFQELPSFIPGSGVGFFSFKGGDAGVHLGAIGAFMVLGLRSRSAGGVRDWLIWTAWLVCLGIAAALNRGGLVAASMMAASLLFVRASVHWASLILVGVFLVAVVGLTDPQVTMETGGARTLSVDQVVENVTSVFSGKTDPLLEGTKEWRLRWWTTIIDYTINGRYFWTGKGFGINLADDDGFQVNADGSLRAPHNGHLELLARGGVPMLVLWILLQLAVGVTLLRAALRARAMAMTWWLGVVGWIVVYWLATLTNASFDVYLEGPMGGILYWSVVGLAIAVGGIIDRAYAADPTPRVAIADAAAT